MVLDSIFHCFQDRSQLTEQEKQGSRLGKICPVIGFRVFPFIFIVFFVLFVFFFFICRRSVIGFIKKGKLLFRVFIFAPLSVKLSVSPFVKRFNFS